MRACLVLVCTLMMALGAGAQEVRKFRQWIGGVESGGAEMRTERSPDRIETREWSRFERPGATVRQEIQQTALRNADGSIQLSWEVRLSEEPLRGEALWSPKEPGRLRVSLRGGTVSTLEIPPGAYIWPGDTEAAFRAAAGAGRSIRYTEFAPATQQWAKLEFRNLGADPLPGFPDAVRFQGHAQEGHLSAELEVWVSPRAGEVKQSMQMAGLTILRQRAELPAPSSPDAGPGFFRRTVSTLPGHPFLPWLPEAVLRWKGPGRQELPEDAQQTRLSDNRYRVRAAEAPMTSEAPVTGPASPEEAPYLASTPLVPFQEPEFAGLVARLKPPPGATRWDLARRVTGFVFEWIAEKDLGVGFANAAEVARNGRGDCTEHGVLAVALLRRLGVPARGALGWAALGETMGLHFWVEVRIGSRWIPVDPTFDQAPASALRLKLGTTDLSDLASLGWDTATLRFVDGAWVPEGPWAEATPLRGETVQAPDGTHLRFPGGRWSLREGRLRLQWEGAHEVSAVTRPTPQQTRGTRPLADGASRLQGWWSPGAGTLWVDLGLGRWLQVDRIQEASAFRFLDLLEVRRRSDTSN